MNGKIERLFFCRRYKRRAPLRGAPKDTTTSPILSNPSPPILCKFYAFLAIARSAAATIASVVNPYFSNN